MTDDQRVPAPHAIRLEIDDAVATVTIDRPQHRNAVTGEMVTELSDVLQRLAGHADVRVVVLTGAGPVLLPRSRPRREPSGPGAPPPEMLDPRQLHISVLLYEIPAMTLAAINGACAGAGLGWAAACDLRVASSTAMFKTAFLDIGVAGDIGLPWSLSRLVGGMPESWRSYGASSPPPPPSRWVSCRPSTSRSSFATRFMTSSLG